MEPAAALAPIARVPAESGLPGPYPVGAYAAQLKRRLREFAHVQLIGEVWGFRDAARVYFELRDAHGALPCSMWRTDFDALGVSLADGMRIVVGGGCDYYPAARPPRRRSPSRSRSCGSPARATCSPSSSACAAGSTPRACSSPRSACAAAAAAHDRRRHRRARQGARRRPRGPAPPGLGGPAGVGVRPRAGPPRRPADRRRAARAGGRPEVEVVIVARGGGSLADLFAFCDEALCRTVALLRVPVIASVGHHTDRTLIDDVAAVCCSTPTHAAEAAVPIDCGAARAAPQRVRAPASGQLSPCRRRPRTGPRPVIEGPGAARRPPPAPPASAPARAACERQTRRPGGRGRWPPVQLLVRR